MRTEGLCGCGPTGFLVWLWKCPTWDPLGYSLSVCIAGALSSRLSVQLLKQNGNPENIYLRCMFLEKLLWVFLFCLCKAVVLCKTFNRLCKTIISTKNILYEMCCVQVCFSAIRFLWLSFCWWICGWSQEHRFNRWSRTQGWEPEESVWIRV